MKNLIFALTLFALFTSVNAQGNSLLNIGTEQTITSKILGAERKVWIHLPTGYSPKSVATYPVLYVLDGETHFHTATALTEHLRAENLAPPMIVVGILHTDRMHDLTFGEDHEYSGLSGGGEQFLSFVEKELIPYIDTHYATATFRTLMGHSVGGLTVVHALLFRPNVFNAYISLDGALWWNNHKIVDEAHAILNNKNYEGKTLFLAIANRLKKGASLDDARKDKSDDTDLPRANLELIDEFEKSKHKTLRLHYQFYPDDGHSSLTFAAQHDALRFVFDFYRLRVEKDEQEDPHFDIASFYTAHYKNVSQKMSYLVRPSKSDLNNQGYNYLGHKQYDKSEFFFNLLVETYPDDPNSYDSLGDLLVAKGEKQKAIAAFKKSLTLGEMKETKEKLAALLEEKNLSHP